MALWFSEPFRASICYWICQWTTSSTSTNSKVGKSMRSYLDQWKPFFGNINSFVIVLPYQRPKMMFSWLKIVFWERNADKFISTFEGCANSCQQGCTRYFSPSYNISKTVTYSYCTSHYIFSVTNCYLLRFPSQQVLCYRD